MKIAKFSHLNCQAVVEDDLVFDMKL